MFRIGCGYDVHKLVEERKLILCGVDIPWEKGLLGHSDADVAVHAFMDAILGALALGDIGKWFSDNDASFKGADSLKLLTHIMKSPELSGWTIENADITIVAQRPKVSPYIQEMRRNIALAAGVELERISVKATTTEKLGFCGRGEGIAAEAVVLMSRP